MVERRTLCWLGLAILTALITSCLGQTDPCVGQTTCDECIAASPDCVWCSSLSPHCNNRNTFNISSCPELVEDPSSNITVDSNNPLSNQSFPGEESVQVQPQVVSMQLRRGSPLSFNMSFKALRNTPLDVYFLLDLSASLGLTIDAIQNNLQEIADTIQEISSAFQIGIGGFVDKDVFPYAGLDNYNILFARGTVNERVDCRSIRKVCNRPFGFRHVLKLTNNVTAFQETINSSAVALAVNVDQPEGGMDALLQIGVCNDIIGWREGALHMVFVITDNEFHIAGDGSLAGIVRPNDGLCHLEEIPGSAGQFEYTFSTLQDYPSIFQVLRELERQVIVPIFGVQQGSPGDINIRTYEELAMAFRTVQSNAFPIGDNDAVLNITTAQQVIQLIQNSYERTSQTIQVNIPQVPGYTITVDPLDCNQTAEGACLVSFDNVIIFRVTVELTDCTAEPQKIMLIGAPYTFSTINVEPMCSCGCSAEELQEENSTVCNNYGTLVCGACDCDEGRFGENCECDSEILACPFSEGEQCGGEERGTCTACGVCVCNEPLFFGPEQGCRCDNESCINNCNENGVCRCGNPPFCECTRLGDNSGRPYFGDACQCNPDNCWNTNFPNDQCRVIGSTASGNCGCTVCDCSVNATGILGLTARANLCVYQNICTFFEPCARCQNGDMSEFGCAHPENRACSTNFTYLTPTVAEEEALDTVSEYMSPCSFLFNDCTYQFYVARGDPYGRPVQLSQQIVCPGLPIWVPYVIGAAILLAIIILGILLLILLKICLVCWDRFEYGKFTKELQHADFAPHENPLYLTPQQDYQNPILRRHSSKR